MLVKCAYCNKELERTKQRAKRNCFCNNSHCMKYQYESNERNRFEITKKANEFLRKRTENRCKKKKFKSYISKRGYKVIQTPRGKMTEHRFIMEQYLNRRLLPTEIIHHINGDRLDNRVENFKLMTNKEHSILHKRIRNNKGQYI